MFTSRIRSLWEGSVFSDVCLFPCGGDGGPHVVAHTSIVKQSVGPQLKAFLFCVVPLFLNFLLLLLLLNFSRLYKKH